MGRRDRYGRDRRADHPRGRQGRRPAHRVPAAPRTGARPLHNGPIDDETQRRVKATCDEIFARCAQSHGGFVHGPDRRKTFEVSEEERLAFWEKLYNEPGFGIWLGNFRDTHVSEAANAELSAIVAEKIRQRVTDPVTAEKLIPKDHGFGTRRVPLETSYYEVYNQQNVALVDISETPIERITPSGIKTTDANCDVVIYATGFDAVTGAFDRIDIAGVGGVKLKDRWADGPSTYLGMSVAGFPNLITLLGPPERIDLDQHASRPRTGCRLGDRPPALHARQRLHRIEATAEAEEE